MLKQAYKNGFIAASKHFGVREASLFDFLLNAAVVTPLANVAIRKAAPGIGAKIDAAKAGLERAWEVPISGAQSAAAKAMYKLRGPRTPAEALGHGLAAAQPAAAGVRTPAAFIEHLPKGPL